MTTKGNFVGRAQQMSMLASHLRTVERNDADQRGRCVLLRGRRRVGKSRLVEVFAQASGFPVFWFSCTKGEAPAQERAQFADELAASSLPNVDPSDREPTASWHAAFRRLAEALGDDTPTVVVIDEIPWLTAQDPAAEGALQTAWDRYLSRKPVLLILIGSDLAMMEHLTAYGRAFHQRGIEMVLNPLNPNEVAEMLDLRAADALDAYLITGGLPLICRDWPKGKRWQHALGAAFSDPTSALIVSGERIMSAEFPAETRARDVLSVIGSGERTFSKVASRLGGATSLSSGTVNAAIKVLVEKRVIAADQPLSLHAAPKEKRYRVDDPFLRFWLRFVGPALPEVERGRGDLALRVVTEGWGVWRGKAIEPVIRESLHRLLPSEVFPDARVVGGWWNRQNNPEVDLVAANSDHPTNLSFVGSIKWRDDRPFDRGDLADLARVAAMVPGVDSQTPLVGVSRSGSTVSDLTHIWGPEDLLAAWQER